MLTALQFLKLSKPQLTNTGLHSQTTDILSNNQIAWQAKIVTAVEACGPIVSSKHMALQNQYRRAAKRLQSTLCLPMADTKPKVMYGNSEIPD